MKCIQTYHVGFGRRFFVKDVICFFVINLKMFFLTHVLFKQILFIFMCDEIAIDFYFFNYFFYQHLQ